VLPVYATVTATPDPDDLARVRAGRFDAVTFTASSTVTNFCDLVGPLPEPAPVVVSIGPVTSRTAAARGLTVTAEADPHTIEALVATLLRELEPGA
jgi:uroporphyrinogen-III synthase